MTKHYLVLHPRNVFSMGDIDEAFDVIDMYKLAETDLTPYKCMIVLGFVDQDYLLEEKQIIADFLEAKKIVCFFGNIVTDWLPGQHHFIAKDIRGHWDYDVKIAKPHPIFEGVTEFDMTVNKGVKGFFARGYHPAPANAEVLLTLPDNEPITYIDRESTAGTIFVHSGGSLFNISGMKQPPEKTTNRIPAQMAAWVQVEYKRLMEGVVANA